MRSERCPRLVSFLSSGIEPGTATATALRKIRITNVVTLAFAVLAIPFLGLVWHRGDGLLSLALIAMVLVCLGNVVLLRRLRRPEISGQITIAGAYALSMLGNISRRDVADPSLGWLYLVAMAAILTIGPRGGWIWIGVILASLVGFWLLPPAADVPADAAEESGFRALLHRLAAVLAVGLLTTGAVSLPRRREAGQGAELLAAAGLEIEADKDLLRRMVDLYRSDGAERIATMQRALAEVDAASLARAAHALGGSAAYFAAPRLLVLCREVEELAESRELAACEARLRELVREHRKLLRRLSQRVR